MDTGRIQLRTTTLVAIGLTGIALLLSSSCASDAASGTSAAIPGGDKIIYLTAMEYKGSAEVSKEPFPSAGLPEGGGYSLKDATGDPPKWEVEAYAWAPASFTVVEGDSVTLQIIGVNGSKHDAELEGHDQQFTVKRGEIAEITFTAGEPGTYRLICQTHAPNMTAQMVVLPSDN